MTVLVEMFGVRGDYGDLCFSPKLLPEQFDRDGRAAVRVRFAGRKLHIVYEQCGGLAYGECRITVHGSMREGNCIRREELAAWDEDAVHEIVVQIPGAEPARNEQELSDTKAMGRENLNVQP